LVAELFKSSNSSSCNNHKKIVSELKKRGIPSNEDYNNSYSYVINDRYSQKHTPELRINNHNLVYGEEIEKLLNELGLPNKNNQGNSCTIAERLKYLDIEKVEKDKLKKLACYLSPLHPNNLSVKDYLISFVSSAVPYSNNPPIVKIETKNDMFWVYEGKIFDNYPETKKHARLAHALNQAFLGDVYKRNGWWIFENPFTSELESFSTQIEAKKRAETVFMAQKEKYTNNGWRISKTGKIMHILKDGSIRSFSNVDAYHKYLNQNILKNQKELSDNEELKDVIQEAKIKLQKYNRTLSKYKEEIIRMETELTPKISARIFDRCSPWANA